MTDLLPPILLHDAQLFLDPFGTVLPIVQWLDRFGEDAATPEEAVFAVAGVPGIFYTLDLSCFPRETRH